MAVIEIVRKSLNRLASCAKGLGLANFVLNRFIQTSHMLRT